MTNDSRFFAAAAVLLTMPLSLSPVQADELGAAVRTAVSQVEPSIVRLRVIGGEQSVDGDTVTSLVTTGVVISNSGEILTSQFALQGNPEAVLAEDNAGHRIAAKIVATDYVRRLVLLKASEGQWTPAVTAPAESVRAGQWSIALGRFYSAESSNVSVGVVSALNRIHGMAIQSDAKISPVNYGGPLINLNGQVLGILVPLSPRGQGNASSGIEWYDSGIGFAIPFQDALNVADRLKAGQDLKHGRLGIRLETSGIFSSQIRIDRVVPNGPAARAGLKKGDQLLTVNGRNIERMSFLEEAVGSSYAGDTLTITANRGDESVTCAVELTEELPVLIPAYLGLMSVRTANAGDGAGKPEAATLEGMLQGLVPPKKPADAAPPEMPKDNETPGFVPLLALENTPASKASLPLRVEVLSLNKQKTANAQELLTALLEVQAGDRVQLEYRVPGVAETKTVNIDSQRQPEEVLRLSSEVLNAITATAVETVKESEQPGAGDADNGQPKAAAGNVGAPAEDTNVSGDVQRRELSFDERGRAAAFFSTIPTGVLPGIVVLLSSETETEEQILAEWKPLLESHKLIVARPTNPENSRLTADDIPLVMAMIKGLAGGSKADVQRIVVVANREQARLAWQLVLGGPSPIRGIALMDGWISPTELEGIRYSDQSILLLESPKNAQSKALLAQSIDALHKAGFPVARPVDTESQRTIADWSLLLRSF